MSHRFRLATASDASAIDSIYNHYVRTSTATFDIQESDARRRLEWLEARSERHPVVVLSDDSDEVVAWGSLSAWRDRAAYDGTAEITVYVDAAHLGKRLGEATFREMERRARELGYHVLISVIAAENVASIRMCERLDYELAGRLTQVGRKFDRFVDIVLYQKVL